jgi:adenine-specific DNA-methyltransferase
MSKKQKLELTWIGKGDEPVLEPRILIEDPSLSFGDNNSLNMLIHGDNLLALKALEQEYSGKIKCIYIDPPYNTGSAFEHYDDGVEHSIWLSLMKQRIEILRTLLTEDGVIWITLDEHEGHYAKVMCDEIFGRSNFLGTVIWQHSIQGKNDSKTFSLHHNYIFAYSKSEAFTMGKLPRQEKHNANYSNPDNDPRGPWRSGDFRSPNLRENLKYNVITPSGNTILPPEKGWRWSETQFNQKVLSKEIIFNKDETKITRKIYLENQGGRVPESIWFGEDVGTTRVANNEIKKLFENTTFDTPKPEKLIESILHLSTSTGDIVLDSFLGSGTTAAVAHKMDRQWIGIELGDHAYTHCVPRMKKVVEGLDDGGITADVGWKGGGGFKFYELATSLLAQDEHGNWVISKDYDANMLAHAMAKQEGFTYDPSQNTYWKQGFSTESDYIFTTTQHITVELLDTIHAAMQGDESLLVACRAFDGACKDRYDNITIKKIPHILLGRCEFGKNDYSLNITDSVEPNIDEGDDE